MHSTEYSAVRVIGSGLIATAALLLIDRVVDIVDFRMPSASAACFFLVGVALILLSRGRKG